MRAAELGPRNMAATFRAFATHFPAQRQGAGRDHRLAALNQYVHEGGGLVVAPGHLSRPGELQQADRHPALAGTARRAAAYRQVRRPTWATSQTSHIRCSSATAKTWRACSPTMPVYKYWPLRGAGDAGLVLLKYGDGAPALIERTFKGPKVGKVLLWTTPLARRPDQGGAIAQIRGRLERVPSGRISAGRSSG